MIDAIFQPETIGDRSPCRSLSDVAPLKRLPKGRVMAPIDLGPAILPKQATTFLPVHTIATTMATLLLSG